MKKNCSRERYRKNTWEKWYIEEVLYAERTKVWEYIVESFDKAREKSAVVFFFQDSCIIHHKTKRMSQEVNKK